jgi:hypothetical protein
MYTPIEWSFRLSSTILLRLYINEILCSPSWSWWISIEIWCMKSKWSASLKKNLNESFFLFFIYYIYFVLTLWFPISKEEKKYRYLSLPYLFWSFHLRIEICGGCHLFFTMMIIEMLYFKENLFYFKNCQEHSLKLTLK